MTYEEYKAENDRLCEEHRLRRNKIMDEYPGPYKTSEQIEERDKRLEDEDHRHSEEIGNLTVRWKGF